MAKYHRTTIDKVKRLAIYLRDNFICAYCLADLHNAHPSQITLDHLVPHSIGGSDHHSNLVTACKNCNEARGTLHWNIFASPDAQMRIVCRRRRWMPWRLAESLVTRPRTEWSAQQ